MKDSHRFPPYRYQKKHGLTNKKGRPRLPSVQEREVIMGFPRNYTFNCLPKSAQGSQTHLDTRLTLLGNSWNVTVVAWLLSQLGGILGINSTLQPQDAVERTAPGCDKDLQTFFKGLQ